MKAKRRVYYCGEGEGEEIDKKSMRRYASSSRNGIRRLRRKWEMEKGGGGEFAVSSL